MIYSIAAPCCRTQLLDSHACACATEDNRNICLVSKLRLIITLQISMRSQVWEGKCLQPELQTDVASRNLRSLVVNKLWCICFFVFKMDSHMGKFPAKQGEYYPARRICCLLGCGGRTEKQRKEREKESL